MRGQAGLAIVSVLALASIPRVKPAGCRSPKIANAMCDGNYSSIEGCVNAIWNDLRFDPHASVLPAIRLLGSANEYEYRNISPSRNATWRWDRIVLCERGISSARDGLELLTKPELGAALSPATRERLKQTLRMHEAQYNAQLDLIAASGQGDPAQLCNESCTSVTTCERAVASDSIV